MGELTGIGGHTETINKDNNIAKTGTGVEKENGYPTDVEGVQADDVIKKGNDEYPVFNVSQEEFWNNQKADRKKIRFKNGSKVTAYTKATRNGHRPFYIKMKDNNGQEYVRKIR